jgi:dimethylamine/trimethylamine dehydrogenase
LGQRGYEVALADAHARAGGRLLGDGSLPGLSSWMRVADHRLLQLQKMANVNLYLESELSAEQVLDFGFQRVYLATGSRWRRDGLGRQHRAPLVDAALPGVYTPDDIFAGATLPSPVLVYDDDHYYMGGALAERLRRQGMEVHLVTPAVKVSEFTDMTMEQHRIQSGLHQLGVHVHTSKSIMRVAQLEGGLLVDLSDLYSNQHTPLECGSLVMVTMRDPNDALFNALQEQRSEWSAHGIKEVQLLGDAYAPGTVAAAVYAGHRAARELDVPSGTLDTVPFRREMIAIEAA